MADPFSNVADAPFAPATRAVAITPNDTAALADIPKGVFVGTGGTIVMRGARGGADEAWRNVPSGTILPFRAQYVRASGTTAADLLALY
jgi:hypothetical protein